MVTGLETERLREMEALMRRWLSAIPPIVFHPGKIDCLDRRASLRMVGACRTPRFARLHIRMLIGGSGTLPWTPQFKEELSSNKPHGIGRG